MEIVIVIILLYFTFKLLQKLFRFLKQTNSLKYVVPALLILITIAGFATKENEVALGAIVVLFIYITIRHFFFHNRSQYKPVNPPRYQTEAQYQRSLMSQSLRYDILKRDGFRCTICGRSQEDGVKLHVDHIKPVSKGGRTERNNLRTLCNECNMGKRAKYDPFGLN